MTEAKIQREIVQLLRTIGFAVWETSQGYRRDPGGTRQTPGIADLLVIGHGRLMFVEVKAPKGKLRPSQEAFRDECIANSIGWHLWRDVMDAWAWAVAQDYIREAA